MSSIFISKVNVNFGAVSGVGFDKWSVGGVWQPELLLSWDVISCGGLWWEKVMRRWFNCHELDCDKLSWGLMKELAAALMTWDVVSCGELWWEVSKSEVDLWEVVKSKSKSVISTLCEVGVVRKSGPWVAKIWCVVISRGVVTSEVFEVEPWCLGMW